MKLRTKIILLSVAVLVWAVVFGSAGIFSMHQAKQFASERRQYETARTLLRQLSVLTFDYLISPTERGRRQWDDVYKKVGPALGVLDINNSEEGQTLRVLRARVPNIYALFSDYIRRQAQEPVSASPGPATPGDEYRKRIVGQLVLENQRLNTTLARLQELSEQKYQGLFHATILMGLSLMVVVAVSVIVVYVAIQRTIIRPLFLLRKSVIRIAGGDWDLQLDTTQQDEIGDLARSFQKMAAGIKGKIQELKDSEERLSKEVVVRRKAESVKDELMRTVSHELRTPLSILKESISILSDKDAGTTDEENTEVLRIAKNNADRLGHLINDLLDISRLEAGRTVLERKKFDLKELVSQTGDNFKQVAEEKGLAIAIKLPKEPVMVFADPSGIERVLMNLVGNAVKFTSKGTITLSAQLCGGEVECCVADTGIGIEPENLPKVFEKFQQFHREAGPGEKGTGLGLSITKGIIDLHKGRIWVQSQLGKGTRFYFTLPLGPTA